MPAHRVRVSVCALRDLEDLRACVDAGVDSVGVLVGVRHRAEDAVPLDVGARILGQVPPYVGRYAVTHVLTAREAIAIVESLPVDTLQVHDAMSAEELTRLKILAPGIRLIKAVAVTSEVAVETTLWDGIADALVLDSVDLSEDRIGGTGRTHDWDLSSRIVASSRIPVVLAGGLNPDNVARAVRTVKPWAVNVNSGVETEGRKVPALVRRFVLEANA